MSTKRVGLLELFFDLVFVFAVTQLVALVLWLIWWAWSQYTWTGNAVDLDRRTTRLWVLAATGAMLTAGRGEFRVDLGHFAERHDLARDLFTLGHLPIVAGTVVFAAAGEPLPAHP